MEQDVYLKIEKIYEYSPVDPAPGHSYSYRRDCFRRKGHERGSIPEDEVKLRTFTAVVFRPYTDESYTVPDHTPLIATDIAEPPVERRLPGTVIYTEPGKRLKIHVLNADDRPHSLHLHGIQYGIDSDGAYPLGIKNHDGVRSDQICPGKTYTYVYDVRSDMIGAWVFHDHFMHLGENARLGVIGGLVVRDPNWPVADYEVPFFMHKVSGRRAKTLFDSGDIVPGGTFARTFENVGTFGYKCFYHGMMSGTVRVEMNGALTASVSATDNEFTPKEVVIASGGTVVWKNDGVARHTVYESGASKSLVSYAINGRSFAGNTPVIEVETGKRIRWYVFNHDFDMEWHNFHPHASHWEFGGQNLDNRTIGPAEAFVADTIAPPVLLPPSRPEHEVGEKRRVQLAALYPVHCHVEPHVMVGMVALIRAKQTVEITKAYEDSLGFPLPVDPGQFECPAPEMDLCISDKDRGHWRTVADSPIFAVHSALLNTGKVIIWSGHAELGPDFGTMTAIYDPADDSYTKVPFADDEDLFCAGHTFLPDGRLIAGGGANQGQVKSTHIFDPSTEEWTRLDGGDLRDFRWYPTMVTMNDGRVAIISGTAGFAGGVIEDIEVLNLSKPEPTPGTDVHYWELVAGSGKTFSGLYPGLHWLPTGDMFFTRTGWNSHQDGLSSRFSFNSPNAGTWTDFAPMVYPDRKEGGSTLLIDDTAATPTAVVFVAGGQSSTEPAIRNCERIDISDPANTTGWRETELMNHARIGNSVVALPNGKVMVIGGRQTSGRFDDTPIFVLECELYDPETDSWALTPPLAYPRQYHSTAILLADGRIFVSGGVDGRLPFGAAMNQVTSEVYSPEYLNAGQRPAIMDAPISATYGATITVQTNEAMTVNSVCLMAPGAMTHHTDTFQRYVKLQVSNRQNSSLDVRIPASSHTAPPGFYMLFILDAAGTPSIGHFLRLGI